MDFIGSRIPETGNENAAYNSYPSTRFFVVAALTAVLALACTACGGKSNGGGTPPPPPDWTLSVTAGTPEVDKTITFSTTVAAGFAFNGNCGTMTTNSDGRGGSIKLTRSGSCELRATAQGTTKTHTLNVVENPKVTFATSPPIPAEVDVGKSIDLTYTLTGVNEGNRNLTWTVNPSDAGTVETVTIAPIPTDLNTVKFVALKLADNVIITATLNGSQVATLNTKVATAPLQTLDLGNGQITAGANIGNQNVVAVWNGNNSASQTTFYVVSNDLEVKFTTSSVAGVFKNCEVYNGRVYCGGSTSARDLNSDTNKAVIFALINPGNGQIENQWQFKVESQATELADFLIRSNGRIFAATNGKSCIAYTTCSRMTEFNSSGSEVNNWWIAGVSGLSGVPVADIVEFKGEIWTGFPVSLGEAGYITKYMVFSYSGVFQGDGGYIISAEAPLAGVLGGRLHSMQVIADDIFFANFDEMIGFGSQIAFIWHGYHFGNAVSHLDYTEPELDGFFQGTINNRSILVMTGSEFDLSGSNRVGWIAWGYPDSSAKSNEGSIIEWDMYTFFDVGYNSIPSLSNITGGATVSNGLLLWGYQDSTARIVKLSYPLNSLR